MSTSGQMFCLRAARQQTRMSWEKRVLTNIMTALKALSDLLFGEAAKTCACALNEGTGDCAETSPGQPAYSSSL